jgi:hypothetical protein
MTVGSSVPTSPADARQALQVSRQGTASSPFVFRDASFGLRDLPFQFGNRLFGLTGPFGAGDLADREPRNLQRFQGLAVSFELRPMPGNFAIGISGHIELPDSL